MANSLADALRPRAIPALFGIVIILLLCSLLGLDVRLSKEALHFFILLAIAIELGYAGRLLLVRIPWRPFFVLRSRPDSVGSLSRTFWCPLKDLLTLGLTFATIAILRAHLMAYLRDWWWIWLGFLLVRSFVYSVEEFRLFRAARLR